MTPVDSVFAFCLLHICLFVCLFACLVCFVLFCFVLFCFVLFCFVCLFVCLFVGLLVGLFVCLLSKAKIMIIVIVIALQDAVRDFHNPFNLKAEYPRKHRVTRPTFTPLFLQVKALLLEQYVHTNNVTLIRSIHLIFLLT